MNTMTPPKIKSFSLWESDSSSPWGDDSYDESFFERYEDVIISIEKELDKKGIPATATSSALIDKPDLSREWEEFESELELLAADWFSELYHRDSGDDDDDRTPLRKKIEAEEVAKAPKGRANFRQLKRQTENALLLHALKVHIDELAKFYQKWARVVRDKRFGI